MSRPRSLSGCVVLVTSDRRSGDLRAALEQRGATVVHTAAVVTTPHLADDALARTTRRLVAVPPDVVVVTTGAGLHGWLESADAEGLGDALRAVLRSARLIAHGAKARAAAEGVGLEVDPDVTGESAARVRDALLAQGVTGRRIAVQHHGDRTDELDADLAAAGADVTSVIVHPWRPPADPAAVVAGVDATASGEVDAVLFTSARAASAWTDAAADAGVLRSIVHRAAHGALLAVAIGEATALPLRSAGIDPVLPEHRRLGALVRSVVTHYETVGESTLETVAGTLHVRSCAAVLGERVVAVSPGGLAVLRALVAARGDVVRRADLLRVLPGESGSGHAVEVAVARLREALGDRRVVETVVKRGYRLALARPSPGFCGAP